MASNRRFGVAAAIVLVALAGAGVSAGIWPVTKSVEPLSTGELEVTASERNTLTWNGGRGGRDASYQLYRAPTRSGPYTLIGTTRLDTYIDDPPKPDIYWYRLDIVSAEGVAEPFAEPTSSDNVHLTGVVGSEGGTLQPTTGTIRLNIPPGAVDEPTTFTIEQVQSPPQVSTGRVLVTRVFDIGPSGTRFEPEATLTLRYDLPHTLAPSSSNGSAQVATRFWDAASASWVAPPNGSVERADSATVTARISHLSVWAAADITIPHGGYSYETKLCEVCHDWHDNPNPDDLLVEPTELDVCYMCHGTGGTVVPNIETEFGTGLRVSFHPVPAAGSDGTQLVCSDCHAEHQSPAEDAGLLYLALGPESFRLSPPEDPIGNDFCYGCHPDNRAAANDVIHNQVDAPNPGTGVACNACHEPHASDFPHLTKASEETLCYQCHSGGSGGTGSDVSTAFTAGVNDYGSTVRIYHHPIATADQAETGDPPVGTRVVECASCHNTHLPGSTLVDPTDTIQQWSGGISEFCMTCHQEQPPNDPVIAAGPTVPYDVRMVQDGHDRFSASQWPSSVHGEDGLQCTDCHDQHGSSNAYMLKQAGGLTGFTDTAADWMNLQSLCASCHDPQDVQEHAADPEFADQPCTGCHYHTGERF